MLSMIIVIVFLAIAMLPLALGTAINLKRSRTMLLQRMDQNETPNLMEAQITHDPYDD